MKKIIIVLFITTIVLSMNQKTEKIVIPEEAIRFRVIANSNSTEDQKLKIQIKDSVEQELNSLMLKAQNKEEARKIITNSLPKVKEVIETYPVNYQISFGKNYFPVKEYKGINYRAGEYESLVITLGNGIGANWWCVMFPPLCLLEAEENELKDVDYQFFVKNLIEQYM